jgi:hypothetical protein
MVRERGEVVAEGPLAALNVLRLERSLISNVGLKTVCAHPSALSMILAIR